MTVNFTTVGMLAGGLGLFLLAVGMITEGLKLARSTRTPAKGILTGITITAIVQSSSAVTVATIGFVNAGLLSLYQAMGVVYGANIGTTMTGWLVAIIGFKIKVEAFALPMIGVGMLLHLVRGDSRWGSLGRALAGFGLFFIGIDVLKNAFEGIAAGIDLNQLSLDGIAGVLLYLGVGFLMTLLTQSSSAAIAITLTAATGGVLSLEAAAAMVIGANVGTTSTAGFAVIGATPNAKRVASAHVVFNLLTGAVALLILPLLFILIKYAGQLLGLEDNPAITLALFHTVFNILGVLIMWPLTSRLSHFLQGQFRSAEEIESKPRYLDSTVAVSPPLALNAICLELEHVGELTRQLSSASINTVEQVDKSIENKFLAVENLGKAISSFLTKIRKSDLTTDIAQQLPKVLYSLQCYTTSAELAFNYARTEVHLKQIHDPELLASLNSFKQAGLDILNISRERDVGVLENKQLDYHQQYRQLREQILLAGSQQRINIDMIGEMIDQIYRLDRLAKQMTRGTRLLVELSQQTQLTTAETAQQIKEEELSETTY